MKRVAVIGASIAGLSAAAFLSRRYRVDLLEQEQRLGGDTNTLVVDGPAGTVPLDTGFRVHDDGTCPNLVRLSGRAREAAAPGIQVDWRSKGASRR